MLSVKERAAEVMEHLCAHYAHGYSQPNRAGVGTGGAVSETITLSDGTKVGISGGDRDCSSAAIECYAALGVDVGGATYTGNMRQCMTGTGNFKWHPWGTYTAKRGDIYLNETHHTAMCLGNGKLGEFSRSELHSTHGAKGDQDGWESHITSFYTYSKGGWDGVLEYVGPEPQATDDTEDDMTECLIDVPKCDECPTGATIYYVAGTLHDIDTPDATEVVRKLYRTAHGGREIPVVQLSATKAVPELQRLVGVVRGGIPAERVIDGIDRFAVRSEDRADGNRGVE